MLAALAVIVSACTALCLNTVPAEAADYEEGDAQLQSQIDAMKTTLADLAMRTDENATSIAELSTTVDEAQELIDEVKASGEATAADVAELEAALTEAKAALNQRIDDLTSRVQSLTANVGQNSASIAALGTAIDEANEAIDALENNAALKSEVNALKNTTDAAVAELKSKVNTMNADIAELKTKLDSVDNSNLAQGAEIAALGTAIDEANEAIDALENNAALKSEVSALKNTTDAAVAELKSKVNTMNTEIADLKAKLESVDNSNLAQGAEIAALGTAIDEANEAIEALENNSALKSEVNALKNTTDAAVAELKSKVNAMNSEIADLKAKLESVDNSNLAQGAEIAALGTAIDEANEAIDALENNSALKSEVNALKNTTDAAVAVLKSKVNTMNADIADLKTKLDSVDNSNLAQGAEIAALGTAIDEANEAIDALENNAALKSEVNALKNTTDAAVAELKSKVAELTAKITELESNIGANTDLAYINKADIAALGTAIDEANEAIDALENNAALKSEVSALKNTTDAAVAELRQKIADLTEEISRLDGEVVYNRSQLADLGTAITTANEAIEALENNGALKSDVNALRNTTDAAVAELRQKIADLTEEISRLDGDVVYNKSQLAALGTAINVANEAIDALENNAALKSEVSALKNTTDAAVAELKQKIADLTEEISRLDGEVLSDRSQLIALGTAINVANDAIEALENNSALKSDVNSLRNTTDAAVAELRQKIADLAEEISRLDGDVLYNNSQLAALGTAIDEANEAIEALESNAALKSEVSALKNTTDAAVAELRQKIADLTWEISRLEGEVLSDRSRLTALGAAINEANEAIEALENNGALKSDVAALRNTTDAADAALRTEINNLKTKLDEVVKSTGINSADITELDAVIKEANDAIAALENNSASADQLVELKDSTELAVAKLGESVAALGAQLDSTEAAMDRELDALRAELKKSKTEARIIAAVLLCAVAALAIMMFVKKKGAPITAPSTPCNEPTEKAGATDACNAIDPVKPETSTAENCTAEENGGEKQ